MYLINVALLAAFRPPTNLPSLCLVAVVLDVVAIEGATAKCNALLQRNLAMVRAVILGITINCSSAPATKKKGRLVERLRTHNETAGPGRQTM